MPNVKKLQEFDFDKILVDNFFEIKKNYFLKNKSLAERLSSGFIDYKKIKNEKDYYEKVVSFITRTAFGLFKYLTKEESYNISLPLDSVDSFCSLIENHIQVGLKLLNYKDDQIPNQLKVDTVVSTVFHEMYHKRYTIEDLKKHFEFSDKHKYYQNEATKKLVEKFLKDNLFKSIFNILEDKRIESLGAKEFPGYVFYFEESRKYCYYLHYYLKEIVPPYENYILEFLATKILLPELMPRFQTLYSFGLDVLISFCKEESADKDVFEKYEKNHKEVSEIFKKIDDYIENNLNIVYSSKFEDICIACEEIYNIIPPQFKDEINKSIGQSMKGFGSLKIPISSGSYVEAKGEISGEAIKIIKETISNEIKSIEEESQKSSKKENTEKNIIEKKIKGVSSNSFNTLLAIKEAPVTEIDLRLYSQAKKISKNIVDKLGFLDSRFARNIQEYEMSEGELDEDELYSISFNNKSIFENIEEIPAYSLDFGILLDESGSMCGRITEAKLATLAIMLGVKDNKHINLFVYGHTADDYVNGNNSITIYKYYNTLQRFTDFRTIFSATSRSNNADGYAIEEMANIMKESKSPNKILVVVSDGQPSANNYGGDLAITHVKNVVDKLEASGITVIQVCMNYIENSGKMFKKFVPFDNDGHFFDHLKDILNQKLQQFSDSI